MPSSILVQGPIHRTNRSLIDAEIEDVGAAVMTGNVEGHLLAIDGIQIELGGDDRLFFEDRLDDIFPSGPIIALPPRRTKASGVAASSGTTDNSLGKSFTRMIKPAARTKQRASKA